MDILHKFCVQLHQLTANTIVQLSKYFSVVLSFGGVPSSNGFAKCYMLHYQQKKFEDDEGVMFQQFGCVNFHERHYQGSGAKLTHAVKNKWSTGWMKAWFYCKVSAHVCPQGGKSGHGLRSHLCGLDFRMEPLVDCPDDDLGDVTFVKVAGSFRGRDVVEEYLACGMHPLSANVSFEGQIPFAYVPRLTQG
jgi:hypothetical protein